VIAMIEKSKYEKIIDVINEQYKNKDIKPNVYGKHISTDEAFILLDMPKKEGMYHGSAFDFRCRRDICRMSGEIIVQRELEKGVSDKFIEMSCIVKKIHKHPESIMASVPGKQYKKGELASHIHFICPNKDYNDTIKIAKFLREY